MADHKSDVSHDQVNRFLRQERFTSTDLWNLVSPYVVDGPDAFLIILVSPYVVDGPDAFLIIDDSIQDKRYARFIELAKRQYSGNVHGTVNGIGLVNLVHSTGHDGDYYPIDYRIYHPDTDGKTKNEHFQAMFERVITHKQLKVRTILFDSWYASVENLKLIHRTGWTFFTTPRGVR